MKLSHVLLIFASLLLVGIFLGCTSSSTQTYTPPQKQEITLSTSNFYFVGAYYLNEGSHYIFCGCKNGNTDYCLNPECNSPGNCRTIDSLSLTYRLTNINSDYYTNLRCRVYEGPNVVSSQRLNGYDSMSYSSTPEVRSVHISSDYSYAHDFTVCCKLDSTGISSNEVCMNQHVPESCNP